MIPCASPRSQHGSRETSGRSESSRLTLVAYRALLSGAYIRLDWPFGPEFDHAGAPARLAALRDVAGEVGPTVNQVVLAWLMGGEVRVIPMVGARSVAQLHESLARLSWRFRAVQRARHDGAQ